MPYIAFFYCHVRPAGIVATIAFQVRAPTHLLAAAAGPPLAPVLLVRTFCWHQVAACVCGAHQVACVLWLLLLFRVLGSTAEDFFSPILTQLAQELSLPPRLAGGAPPPSPLWLC